MEAVYFTVIDKFVMAAKPFFVYKIKLVLLPSYPQEHINYCNNGRTYSARSSI